MYFVHRYMYITSSSRNILFCHNITLKQGNKWICHVVINILKNSLVLLPVYYLKVREGGGGGGGGAGGRYN